MLQFDWTEEKEALEYVTYLVPGTRKYHLDIHRLLEEHYLPVFDAYCPDLPEGLDALILCSDLQGHVQIRKDYQLLGEWLPQFLKDLLCIHFPEMNAKSAAVCLCGDMHANIEKRGGSGDVRKVWDNFLEHFRWVAGVAGNHDEFGSKAEFEAFKKQQNIHFLDGNIIEVDGLVLGGVSGIIGDKNKPFRVPELKYLQNLEKVVSKRPELLLLHESPEHDDHWGNSEIRKILEKSIPVSVFCGHSHWKKVAAEYPNGCKIYNIDSRVIILHRNKKDL